MIKLQNYSIREITYGKLKKSSSVRVLYYYQTYIKWTYCNELLLLMRNT